MKTRAKGRASPVKKEEIDRVFKRGQRARRGALGAIVLKKEGGPLRAAYVVGKKLGGAVKRNRIKRVLREAFLALTRRSRGTADVVFIPSVAWVARLEGAKQEMGKIFEEAGLIQ